MTVFSRAFSIVALAAAVAGCQLVAAVRPTEVRGAGQSAPVAARASLAGMVTLPESAVGPGAVMPTGVGRVIPAGGGQVMPTGIATYRLRAAEAEPELPVAGADVSLRDPVTRKPLPGVSTVKSDGAGRFRVAGLPAGALALIEVRFTAGPAGKAFRLLSLGRAEARGEPAPIPVNWATTAATANRLRALGTDAAAIGALEPATLLDEAEALRARLATLPAAARAAWLAEAVQAPPAAAEEALVLPAELPALPAVGSAVGPASSAPSVVPSAAASLVPEPLPTALPTVAPPAAPSPLPPTIPALVPRLGLSSAASPSSAPSGPPPASPSPLPSVLPSAEPAMPPSAAPSVAADGLPTVAPAVTTSPLPTTLPSASPSVLPAALPSSAPTAGPTPEATPTPMLPLPSAL